MCLRQHIDKPTHEDGHTLDLIITQDTDDLIYGTPHTHRPISDHCSIFKSQLTTFNSQERYISENLNKLILRHLGRTFAEVT